MMRNLTVAAFLAMLPAGACLCAGCAGPPPSVFDKAAIDRIRCLAVLPFSSDDPGVGPTASGIIVSRLAAAQYRGLGVIESPALWRLASDKPVSPALSDAEAIDLGRQAGADAVLTGTYLSLGSVLGAASKPVPDKLPKDLAFLRVRLLSVPEGRPIYVHEGGSGQTWNAPLVPLCVIAAIGPLEEHLQSSRAK